MHLPKVVYEKFPELRQDPTLQDRYKGMMGLVNKHSGELVEASSGTSQWTLRRTGQSLTALALPAQFWLNGDGRSPAECNEQLTRLTNEDMSMLFDLEMERIGIEYDLDNLSEAQAGLGCSAVPHRMPMRCKCGF